MEHLMNFSVILKVIGEEFAGEFESVLLLIKTRSHQHFKASQLQLSEFELGHVCLKHCLPALDLLPDVGRLVDNALHLHLVLLAAQFGHHFLVGAELVGVVDVDEVGLDVVRNGLVVLGLPEGSLPRGAVQPRLHHQRELHQLIPIIYPQHHPLPSTTQPTTINPHSPLCPTYPSPWHENEGSYWQSKTDGVQGGFSLITLQSIQDGCTGSIGIPLVFSLFG